MKEKQKRSPRVVIAFVLASIMILITVSVLALFVASFVVPNRAEERGLDSWRENYRWNDFFEYRLNERDKAVFLAVHAPSDGDYYYSARSTWFNADGATVLLCWLTYDDPDVYASAKASRLHYVAAYSNSFDGNAEAFGFSFCFSRTPTDAMQHSTKKLQHEAFGYNDETRTLVFVGFDAHGDKERAYAALADTDYEAFLSHYYGEWFDWEAGVGIHLPE